jgi:hypothetical protein
MVAPTAAAPHAGIQPNADGRPAPMPPELKAEIRRLLAAALIADVRADQAAHEPPHDEGGQ